MECYAYCGIYLSHMFSWNVIEFTYIGIYMHLYIYYNIYEKYALNIAFLLTKFIKSDIHSENDM